jgi:Family of unknown function (DUF6049)
VVSLQKSVRSTVASACLFVALCAAWALPAQATTDRSTGAQFIGMGASVTAPHLTTPVIDHLALDLGAITNRSTTVVRLALYPRVFARSILLRDATTPPTGPATSLAVLLPSSCVAGAGPTISTRFGLGTAGGTKVSGAVSSSCRHTAPTLAMRCAGPSCNGVYPLVVTTITSGVILARFTTFLTVMEGAPASTIAVAPVFDLTPGPTPTSAELGPATALANVAVNAPSVATTAIPAPVLVNVAATAGDAAYPGALRRVLHTPGDEVLRSTYVPIDAQSLRREGLGGEVTAQFAAGRSVLEAAGLLATKRSIPVTDNLPAVPSISGYTGAHLRHLIVGPSAVSADPAFGSSPGQPFTLTAHNGTSVTAAVADPEVATFATETASPQLGANQLLAALSFGYFEFPGLPDRRGFVLVFRPESTPASFAATVLAGLRSSPILHAVTLTTYFESVPVGGNGAPTGRVLTTTTGIPLRPTLASSLRHARSTVTSVSTMVHDDPAVAISLNRQLLAAEDAVLPGTLAQAQLGALNHRLTTITSAVTVPAEGVTLTSRSGSVPITLQSTSSLPLTVLVHLSSQRLRFPSGDLLTVVVRQPTTTLRVSVVADTTGDLPITVTLTSPDGRLQLGHNFVTAQITAFSLVGIVLTGLAGAVLTWWWFTTWRRRAKEKARRD